MSFFRSPDFRRTPPTDAIHVTDNVQIGRYHHTVVRLDRYQSQGRDDRRDIAHAECDQHRCENIQGPPRSSTLHVRRAVVVLVVVPGRHLRPFFCSATTTTTAVVAGQKHTRARPHGARRDDEKSPDIRLRRFVFAVGRLNSRRRRLQLELRRGDEHLLSAEPRTERYWRQRYRNYQLLLTQLVPMLDG